MKAVEYKLVIENIKNFEHNISNCFVTS